MLHLLAADPSTSQQIDWLNLSDATNIVRLVGLLIPLLTALITKKVASQGLKAVTTLVLSVLTGTIGTLVAADGHTLAWQAFANAFFNAFFSAIVAHYGFWKPTGIAGTVARVTQTFGLGAHPVLETADKGDESAGAGINATAARIQAQASRDGGYVSTGMALLLLGLALICVAIFVAGLHVLFVIGVVLIVVGLVLLLVGGPRRL